MRIFQIIFCLGIVVQAGCGAAESMVSAQPADGNGAPTPRERVAEGSGDASDPAIVLTYRLPSGRGGESTAGEWNLAAPKDGEGFSDPNRIVYDDAYVEAYVEWAVNTPTECGEASYQIATDEGVKSVSAGLDQVYLGSQFRAERLTALLKSRVEAETVERTFRVMNPELGRLLREHPDSLSAKRVRQSPWDRDTCAVVTLLGVARHRPAFEHLKALLEDENAHVRYTVVIAIGQMAAEVPEALDLLAGLLSDEQLGSEAATALTFADATAVPVLIKAFDSDEWIVRNRAVHALPHVSFAAAQPALLAALEHRDAEVRNWGVRVLLDLQSRTVAIDSVADYAKQALDALDNEP
jgi:hypothetical protein